MTNPHKLSDKLETLRRKEEETNTAFVQIMREVSDARNGSPVHAPDIPSHQQNTWVAHNQNDVHTDGSSPLHLISGGPKYKEQLEILRNKGIVPNKGKWKAEEIQTLRNNMKEFLALHELDDYSSLVNMKTKEDKIFRNETQFVLHMCRGIQRTRRDINLKTVHEFSDYLFKGKFSENEQKELMKLQRQYGNKWKQIGILMDRHFNNLQNVHNYRVKSWNKGHWNVEEDKLLIRAVQAFIERGKTISWAQVSKAVGTRSRVICRIRWLSNFIQSKQAEEHIVFDEKEIYKLVSLIYESNTDDEYFVDWNGLSVHFKNVTPSWLKWKFGVVCKEVPRSHMLEFGELVDKLYDIYQRKIDDSVDAENTFVERNRPVLVNDDDIYNKDINYTDHNEDVSLQGNLFDYEDLVEAITIN